MGKNLDELFIISKHQLNEDSKLVVSLVRQWADREILSNRMEYRENYSQLFSEKRRKLHLDIGLQRLTLPAENGGFGWNDLYNAPDIAAAMSEIGRADASIGVLLAMQYALLATFTMNHNLDKNLCGYISSCYVSDQVHNSALIMPGPGMAGHNKPLFHGRALSAEAVSSADGYTISGTELRPLTGGSIADLYCTVCYNNQHKPCLAIVPRHASGISTGPQLRTTGLSASVNADITFNSVSVPEENMIGRDGAVEELYSWLNLLFSAVSVGAGINFFEILSDWSSTRTIKGGTTLKNNPLCASVLAEVAGETALAKMLLFDLAQIIRESGQDNASNEKRLFTFSQLIGTRIQHLIMRAINRGMELMGSAGYAREWHAEKHWRDVKTIQSLLCGVASDAPVKLDIARYFYDCTEI